MTEATSPAEVVERLEAMCGGFLSPLPQTETALIRAAASLIRELTEALKPFADEAAVYARNSALEQYPDTYLACVPLGAIRRAAKLVEPQ